MKRVTITLTEEQALEVVHCLQAASEKLHKPLKYESFLGDWQAKQNEQRNERNAFRLRIIKLVRAQKQVNVT